MHVLQYLFIICNSIYLDPAVHSTVVLIGGKVIHCFFGSAYLIFWKNEVNARTLTSVDSQNWNNIRFN
jgi:hypothetical protein